MKVCVTTLMGHVPANPDGKALSVTRHVQWELLVKTVLVYVTVSTGEYAIRRWARVTVQRVSMATAVKMCVLEVGTARTVWSGVVAGMAPSVIQLMGVVLVTLVTMDKSVKSPAMMVSMDKTA